MIYQLSFRAKTWYLLFFWEGGGGGTGGLVREAALETLSQSIIVLNILDLIQN